jgi:hypothetical protein
MAENTAGKQRGRPKPVEPDEKTIKPELNAAPKEARAKLLGGGRLDDWNNWIHRRAVNALPSSASENKEATSEGARAVSCGIMDVSPADPIEGILVTQLMVANEAALSMYQRAWAQPLDFFEARTKYLQLADKAARTVIMLTERLDHHRGRGQQQITVKHVTTNNVTADQAIITDSVATSAGTARNVASAALLAASSEPPMPILNETRRPNPMGVGRGTKKK